MDFQPICGQLGGGALDNYLKVMEYWAYTFGLSKFESGHLGVKSGHFDCTEWTFTNVNWTFDIWKAHSGITYEELETIFG